MKNITQIALVIVLVVTCAALRSSAQTRPGTVRITMPSGKTFTVRAPVSPLLKPAPFSVPAPVSNPLPLWATQLIYPATSPFKQQPLPAFSNPVNTLNSPFLQPKTELFTDRNNFWADQQKIELARTVTNGLINLALKNKEKNANRLPVLSQPTLITDSSLNAPAFAAPQYKPASKNSFPVVVVTSNLDKPAAPKTQLAPATRTSDSGLTTNSSLKVVHVTPDGTAILIDGQNNYYSLPLNNVGNNQGNALRNAAQPAEQRRSSQRNRSRSRN